MRKLTVGIDVGDRISRYCILNEDGEILFEGSLPTTKSGMNQVFGAMPRCRIAMETGAHSPWVSRQLSESGHEVIVANARNVH
jgi:transposase